MNEDRSTKQINNSICGMKGCDKPAKENVIFELGFSAGFCVHCSNRLKNQGLGDAAI